MPGLVVFGRRWRVGSDDLHVPALLVAVTQGMATATLGGTVGRMEYAGRACDAHVAFRVVCAVLVGLGGLTTLVSGALSVAATRGLILESGARARVPALFRATTYLSGAEAAVGAFLCAAAWRRNYDAAADCGVGGTFLRGFATTALALLVVHGLFFLLCWDPGGGKNRGALRSGPLLALPLRPKPEVFTVAARFGCVCACVEQATCGLIGRVAPSKRRRSGVRSAAFSSQNAALFEVAVLVTDWCGVLDLVPGDVLAGLGLLRARQLAYRRSPDFTEEYRTELHPSAVRIPSDDATLREAAYYWRYAFGVYGWKLGCLRSPRAGCYEAGRASATRAGCGALDSAMAARAGGVVVFEDAANVENERVPVVVYRDDERRAFVVACRGTLSLEDCLSDASCAAADLGAYGLAGGHTAHAGCAGIAANTARLVAPSLREAFAGTAGGPRYGLYCVGHSLGAGVAALLTLFLRPEFPAVRCFAYEPPGALVDDALAEAMEPFCVSTVTADDLVPRLGLAQLFRLRDDVVDSLARCRVPKWRALASMSRRRPDASSLFFTGDDARVGEAAALSEACAALLAAEARPGARCPRQLSLPGVCVHLAVRFRNARGARSGVDAFRTPRTHFHDIRVSGSMLADHMVWRVRYALDAAAGGGGGAPAAALDAPSDDGAAAAPSPRRSASLDARDEEAPPGESEMV